jgi:hypothetical protein
MNAYIALAHNIKDTENDDCEWEVFTGVNAESHATYRATRWASRDGWIAFVRETGEPVARFRSQTV